MQAFASGSKYVFDVRTKTLQFCAENGLQSTFNCPPEEEDSNFDEVRKSIGKPTLYKCRKSLAAAPAPKDNVDEGSSAVTLNAIDLGSVIAEALKGSFEGLRDSMNVGFAGLGNLIASHFGDHCGEDSGDAFDSSVSNDYVESLVEDEPPAKKQKPNESGKNSDPLITKLTKPCSSPSTWGPPLTGSLRYLWIKSSERKLMKTK